MDVKATLKAITLELRRELEGKYDQQGTWQPGDLERRLASTGVRRDRAPVPVDGLPHLHPEDLAARRVVDAFILSHTEAGQTREGAIAEFVRGSAYSWANRLLALRCMEARGLIDEIILQKETYGGRSLQHNRLANKEPQRCAGEDEGLFALVFDEFARRAVELPLLFDPRAAEVALRPSVASLKRCVSLLSGTAVVRGQEAATDEIFVAPDALGWTYQHWNTEEKDRVFEKVRTKKGSKIEGAEIIPATCIYTEPYMVKFLVQNSLGSMWMGMHAGSRLCENWEYFVRDADRAPTPGKAVADLTFLDPACGSGHFLVEAFELFYMMYTEEGVITAPAQICSSILERNLYGIDIDERAVQIAALALVMKAKEKAPDFVPRRVNLVATNIRLPVGKEHLDAFFRKHPEDTPLRPALHAIFEGLAHADELGSLLQLEEPVEKEIRALKARYESARSPNEQQALWAEYQKPAQGELPIGVTSYDAWKERALGRIRQHFEDDACSTDLGAAFFGEAASNGMSLVDLLARRYDVVAANPPFMGSRSMAPNMKKFVANAYPAGKRDLLTAFIQRALQLVRPEFGAVALVSQQTILFLKSYAALRGSSDAGALGFVRAATIDSIAQLGPGAFADVGGVVVSPILLVMFARSPDASHRLLAIRTLDCPDPASKAAALQRRCRAPEAAERYRPKQGSFLALDRTPILFWVPDALLELFQSKPTLGRFALARQGICTTNNGRFVRFGWEVDNSPHRDLERWLPASKGGGYRKWRGFENHYLDWQLSGVRVKQFQEETPGAIHWSGRMPSEDYFFRGGWTYSAVAPVIGARLLDERSLFLDTAPVVIPHNRDQNEFFGAILNSRIASYLVRSLTQDAKIREGYLQRIPWPCERDQLAFGTRLNAIVHSCLALKDFVLGGHLVERSFVQMHYATFADGLRAHELAAAVLHTLEGELERLSVEAYGLTGNDVGAVIAQMGKPPGWNPLLAGYDRLPELPPTLGRSVLETVSSIVGKIARQTPDESTDALKTRLRTIYESGANVAGTGTGAADDLDAVDEDQDEDEADDVVGGGFSTPHETMIEAASAALRLHPLSIYWLLREGIEKEGWRCNELKRQYILDQLATLVLGLLGHRWPSEIEAGHRLPESADRDGIIPLTEGTSEPTLLAKVRKGIGAEFGSERARAKELEIEEHAGEPLASWLGTAFFKRHISQFRKRPIAWQLASSGNNSDRRRGRGAPRSTPAFSCLVFYHRLDADLLPKLRTHYVGPLRTSLQTELGGIERLRERSADQDVRRLELEAKIDELKAFDLRLERVIIEGFATSTLEKMVAKEPLDKWTSRDGRARAPETQEALLGQERRYDPDLNDGVRVNIAPLQHAGLLGAEVLAPKDVQKAIADRAVWRADERRWCRDGKLPQPGWWPLKERT